jgi:hypothetical protein
MIVQILLLYKAWKFILCRMSLDFWLGAFGTVEANDSGSEE